MSPEVRKGGMLMLEYGEQPAIVWITDTYLGEETDIKTLKSDTYTNWSYIVLVPTPLADRVPYDEWEQFLKEIGRTIKKNR